MASHEETIRRFNEIGIAKVREELTQGTIYGADGNAWAISWLADREREERARVAAEGIDVARSAKDAAWASAEAAKASSLDARRANTVAYVSLWVAIVSAIAAAVSVLMTAFAGLAD